METPPKKAYERQDIGERMANVRTKRELADLFRYLGIHAHKRFGQNFLVDHNLLDFVVRTGEVGPTDLVIDIGCGTGLLSAHLADEAGMVLGIEIDRALHAIASRYLEGRHNVELLQGDVLASKHTLAPLLLDAVARHWDSGRYGALKVVSNLPYAVASLVVPNLLEADLPITLIVSMVQREMAERLYAQPGSRDYGSLSLVVQALAKVRLVRTVPPEVFWPRPRVESAIVRIDPDATRAAAIRDYARFIEITRGAFTHRRKRLANALSTAHVVEDKKAAEAALAACGIDPSNRAEHLGLDEYIALANTLTDDSP